MAIKEKEIIPISKFLSNNNLSIPEFQRPYKWTEKNVIQLLEDIEKFKKGNNYRIGTIVIFEENGIREIVDGQQRTVTFLLLLRAIISHKNDNLVDKNLKQQLDQLKISLFEPKFKSDVSKLNIQNNYREIERRINSIDENFIDFFLNNCEITYFAIDDISEAFQFFDSQNARGKDLEPHDLLKAFHLRELDKEIKEEEITKLVDSWEEMDSKELSHLFADFLYRVRGWSKGDSSRYFTKKDTPLFKGINLKNRDDLPYIEIYKMVEEHIRPNKNTFPFQLDQTIINGEHFFKMITYYKNKYHSILNEDNTLSPLSKEIMLTINKYDGINRTGDKYVRMLFNCCLLYYVDKFGTLSLDKAIQVIFIWAYKPRLTYQSLQLASIDNYVITEFNLFKKIRDAIYKDDIINISLPLIKDEYQSPKTNAIKEIFIKMKYYGNVYTGN